MSRIIFIGSFFFATTFLVDLLYKNYFTNTTTTTTTTVKVLSREKSFRSLISTTEWPNVMLIIAYFEFSVSPFSADFLAWNTPAIKMGRQYGKRGSTRTTTS
ncbi:hypothetical protein COCC4DRAFT_33282 [Bipolaris maydis ATCC 48331]|uniref:Uncharacterized protein n=2 Tax=Cochliobolus heterostrophus TaxID=5016 RepID=M2UW40_COCH5|nr:uncharacterized protein COCC4DRAFT_33282 [Bipolaris maydis ATCC 48331]EMD97766.1 hypothetical protein COCHEDRAFT_1019086 [Bipolaris maydis C5]KAJ5031844.1 hypothetical protein J3E73DRAFT_270402 [Bipolaris maydis]ENI02838.1 hypothetical protein COCC4DRAFT_33282 [Bipolaris maydis ATCC 48331]KAJ5060098.1 hypothetical protein J3E74DRAFT_341762 [Bipolaris maydis]KAJ6202105.1 hypothetical protein J3E72DRAFT_292015 [Bipolaris maydis]